MKDKDNIEISLNLKDEESYDILEIFKSDTLIDIKVNFFHILKKLYYKENSEDKIKLLKNNYQKLKREREEKEEKYNKIEEDKIEESKYKEFKLDNISLNLKQDLIDIILWDILNSHNFPKEKEK